jgi:hypothetical protein
MPQDRVIEFSRYDSIDRLKETELAAGDQEMYQQHLELNKLTEQERVSKSDFDFATKDRDNLMERKEQLEKDVKAYREQEGRMEKVIALVIPFFLALNPFLF